MATKQSTIDYLLDQLASVPDVRVRKMFGEYALYCNDKVVALVCDDELFIKITEAGKEFVGDQYQEGNAYPGAKPSMRIDMDMAENRDWLCELITITEESLPAPVVKKKKIANKP
ncbi:MAG: TfoX/Sxy family protein [Candidatus Latescibacterota bacterium]|jgi:TfoX/Sxy family transcriptional regulator of competence genes